MPLVEADEAADEMLLRFLPLPVSRLQQLCECSHSLPACLADKRALVGVAALASILEVEKGVVNAVKGYGFPPADVPSHVADSGGVVMELRECWSGW